MAPPTRPARLSRPKSSGKRHEHELDPRDYLRRNDAYAFFEAAGGLFKTGPTQTNVCDLRVIVVSPPAALTELRSLDELAGSVPPPLIGAQVREIDLGAGLGDRSSLRRRADWSG